VRSMRIAFYTSGLGLTGGNKRVLFFAKELCRLGHKVHIILSHQFKNRDKQQYPCPVISDTEAFSHCYDFLAVMNPLGCLIDVFKEIKADKRGIFILHLSEPLRYTNAYQQWLDTCTTEFPLYVFGNNPSWQNVYEVRAPHQAHDLIGGVDCCFKSVRRIRKRTVFTIVCNASITEWKGFHLVQQALNRLRFAPVQVVAFAHRTAHIDDLRWPVQLHMNVPYREMPVIYTQGDIFISFENNSAGWGNTAIEAMMCGVPVICTEGGTQAYARHRENAFVVERDPTALRNAIEYLYRNQKMRSSISPSIEKRRQMYRQFSYRTLVHRFLEIISEKQGLLASAMTTESVFERETVDA
jgi:glycosyltransferase involved in cell wall biosynthesis